MRCPALLPCAVLHLVWVATARSCSACHLTPPCVRTGPALLYVQNMVHDHTHTHTHTTSCLGVEMLPVRSDRRRRRRRRSSFFSPRSPLGQTGPELAMAHDHARLAYEPYLLVSLPCSPAPLLAVSVFKKGLCWPFFPNVPISLPRTCPAPVLPPFRFSSLPPTVPPPNSRRTSIHLACRTRKGKATSQRCCYP